MRQLLLAAVLAMAGSGALAQSKPLAPAGRDQPIEINADSLEVQQDKQLATFNGNVDAVQGDMRLKADQLRVWYRQGGNQKPATGQQSAAGSPAGAIVRIDALGRVFVSTPTETAQGDQGVYDVEKRTILLTGRVVVTREKNVVRGDRLVMDLNSGQARLDGQNRVHGLFVPSKGDKP